MGNEEVYVKKEEIEKIIRPLRQIKFNELKRHPHYEYSLMQKNTDENLIKETYYKFERIGLAKKRVHSGEKTGYDLHYELDDGSFVVIVVSFQTSPPTIVNGFHAKKDFKRFKKNLLRHYGKLPY